MPTTSSIFAHALLAFPGSAFQNRGNVFWATFARGVLRNFEIIDDNVLLIKDEAGSAVFSLNDGLSWTDNIGDWFASEGYYVKVNEDINLPVSTNKAYYHWVNSLG